MQNYSTLMAANYSFESSFYKSQNNYKKAFKELGSKIKLVRKGFAYGSNSKNCQIQASLWKCIFFPLLSQIQCWNVFIWHIQSDLQTFLQHNSLSSIQHTKQMRAIFILCSCEAEFFSVFYFWLSLFHLMIWWGLWIRCRYSKKLHHTFSSYKWTNCNLHYIT